MRAELITIGDELCRGEIVNTNASWLAARLWELQITVEHIVTCGDVPTDMRSCIEVAAGRSDLVFITGGLGPTMDDLTVDVMAEIAGQSAVVHKPSAERMKQRFADMGMTQVANAIRQVRYVAGGRAYDNPAGLAPGFEISLGRAKLFCLPGPPRELHAIYNAHLEKRICELRSARGLQMEHVARKIFHVFGRGESIIAAELEGLELGEGASLHYQVKFPETLVKLVVRDCDGHRASQHLNTLCDEVRKRLGQLIYGEDDSNLPAVVVQLLASRGLSLATAESCTGGMVASLLTGVPGSSRSFLGGCVTYSNAEKVRQLGVAPATLAAHGAVSEAVVLEMATGLRKRSAADLCVSISGIAGPGGGSEAKPVGTVWVAVAGPHGVRAKKHSWSGSRGQVRRLAAHWALDMVRKTLLRDGEDEQ